MNVDRDFDLEAIWQKIQTITGCAQPLPEPGNFVLLEGISWEQYLQVDEVNTRRALKVSFLHGQMELYRKG